MSIFSLVYVSTAQTAGYPVDAGMIDEILGVARSKNLAADVTGALLFTEGKFVQVLEGGRDNVYPTFERIAADSRHVNVEILSAQFAERRRFKEWSMAFVGDNQQLRARFTEAPLATLGKRPAGDALLDFMLELARSVEE